MFKVRLNCFETNSSSMDRYDDHDDDYPKYTTANQIVRIILKWAENATEERRTEILDNILNGEINDVLFKQFDDFYNDPDGEVYDCSDDCIELHYEVMIGVSYHGSYSPATRYEPAEYPEPELDDDWNGVPVKNQPFPAREDIKTNLLKAFSEKGWTEIVGIENIYGEDIDEDEALSNID